VAQTQLGPGDFPAVEPDRLSAEASSIQTPGRAVVGTNWGSAASGDESFRASVARLRLSVALSEFAARKAAFCFWVRSCGMPHPQLQTHLKLGDGRRCGKRSKANSEKGAKVEAPGGPSAPLWAWGRSGAPQQAWSTKKNLKASTQKNHPNAQHRATGRKEDANGSAAPGGAVRYEHVAIAARRL